MKALCTEWLLQCGLVVVLQQHGSGAVRHPGGSCTNTRISTSTCSTSQQSNVGICRHWCALVASETLRPTDLQVVERSGPGLSSWEKELGTTEDRATKLNPHLQTYSVFYLPVTEFDHLFCCSSPLPSTTLLQLRATAMWHPPPSFLSSGANGQVLLFQPPSSPWISFLLQSTHSQPTPLRLQRVKLYPFSLSLPHLSSSTLDNA